MISRLQEKTFPDNYLMIPTHPTPPYLIPSSFSLPSYKKKKNIVLHDLSDLIIYVFSIWPQSTTPDFNNTFELNLYSKKLSYP